MLMSGKEPLQEVEKDGNKHTLLPLKNEVDKEASGSIVMMMSGKEMLQEVEKDEELQFVVLGKPKVILTSTNLDYLLEEI